jgi:hypothetical protein
MPSLSSLVLQFLAALWHAAHWNHLVDAMNMEKGFTRAMKKQSDSSFFSAVPILARSQDCEKDS